MKKNTYFKSESEKAFEFKEYNNLLKTTGFQIKEQLYPGLLGYVLYYNPDAFPLLNLQLSFLPSKLAKLDLLLGKTIIGKVFSFATLTIAEK